MRRTYLNDIQQRRGESITSFLAVFLLVAIRFMYFGFRYYPQLDDYIQHHNYAQQGSLAYLSEKLGLFAARPLAGLLDVTLWSWLWECSIVGVLIISAMYALAAIEFQKLFNKLFCASSFFIVIFALLPLGIEGTYWMSASTRIIPGLLFAAFSARCFLNFLENGRKLDVALAFIFQFITFCFYEQTAVLSCALNVLIALLYARKSDSRWLFSFSCIAAAALYFFVCHLAGPSVLYDGRTSIILPTSAYYFDTFLPDLLSQMYSAFFGGGYYTLVYGFIRGVMRIISDGAWVYCLIVIIACVFFGFVSAHFHREKRGKIALAVGIGVPLILAPLAPFFIIENPWFSFRGTVTSFVGIALVIDALVRLIFKNQKYAIAVLGSAVALVFCVCSVSEIADYKATYDADTRVVSTLSEIAEDYPDGGKVAILGVEPYYVSEQNAHYHEHIIGVTESSWALTGAIRCYNDNQEEWITYVPISLKKDPIYKKWEYSTKTVSSMDGIYLYDYDDDTLEKLSLYYRGDGQFDLYFANGERFGSIVESEEIGRFFEE